MRLRRLTCWLFGHDVQPAEDRVFFAGAPAKFWLGRYCARCGRSL